MDAHESTTGTAAASGGAFSTLLVRTGFGLAYAAIFIACLVFGPVPTAVFTALMSALCCYEFFRIARLDGKVPNEPVGLAAAALFPVAALGRTEYLFGVFCLLILTIGLWYVFSPRTRLADVSATLFGPVYTGFMLSAIVLTRCALGGFEGMLLSVGVCASLWLSDTFAYLVGSRFGRHKMVPKISPKKSWEGFFGGLAGSILVWVALFLTGFYRMNLPFALLTGAAVSVLGVFGDLIESRLKRGVGVKDSGSLIPGHGGMLDRTDSLIFGCMTAYLILALGGVI